MEVKDKVGSALFARFNDGYICLEEDDGISGFVVSAQFKGMSSLDRQERIEEALDLASPPLTPKERRQVLMIATLTPAEYDAVGASIRVQKVLDVGHGAFEVRVYGRCADAEYVRGALKSLKGVQTTEPKQVADAAGMLMSFEAKGSKATPLTKDKLIRTLKKQAYVDVMPDAAT